MGLMTQRSNQQNKALHLYCRMLSDALNTAGLDQRTVLKPGIEIPWCEQSVKTSLWKPIQEAMLRIESTTEAETGDYSKVYEVLTRHLGDKLGIVPPEWPTRFREDER